MRKKKNGFDIGIRSMGPVKIYSIPSKYGFSDCGKGQILGHASLLQEYLKGIPSNDKSFVEKEIEENQK